MLLDEYTVTLILWLLYSTEMGSKHDGPRRENV